MNGAFEWLSQLVEWLGKFFPRWQILDLTEGAVKFVRGNCAKYCGPGIHWYWPVITTFQVYPIVRQADRLQTQTIVTMDDKTIVVGGIIVYSVPDLLALLTTVHSAQTAIRDISLTSIHDVCCQLTWDELKTEQRKGTLDTKLRHAAKAALKDYGVEVIKVMLTDLAPARVLKLMQSTSMEEN